MSGAVNEAPAYPAEWESDVVLTDGDLVHVRPLRPDDDQRMLEFYEGLSEESIYLRFFSPLTSTTAARLDRLTLIDYHDHMALAALIGGAIVAVARYDRIDDRRAEVAFTVRDDQHGRGIATLLLEHLAVIARANGFDAFAADTLPGNAKMLNVFAAAGWDVDRRFADGTVRVKFSIEPTDVSLAAIERREHVAEAASIARILAPRSIAVVGASREPGTVGNAVFTNLIEYGFQGPTYPVNPATRSVAGVRAYPTVLDVPDDVDVAIVVVPAAAVLEVVEQCAQKHVRGVVIISAGFAETGVAGAQLQRQVVATARAHGMRVVGPNCLGILNTAPSVRMNASFSSVTPPHGKVAFLSQSGGLGMELMARAERTGIGVSTFVSVGNRADVSGNDLLQHWSDDAETDVILLYLESFGNPQKFSRLAQRVARKKPIIAVKGARTPAGTRAGSATGPPLATPDVAVDALFRQAGVIRVDTLGELLETAQLLAHQPLPAGRRVAIIGNMGGPLILAADACIGAGLEVPELDDATQARLRELVSHDDAARNPVDLAANASATGFRRALETVLRDDGIDAVLVIIVPPVVTAPDDVAREVAEAAATAGERTIVACFLGHDGVPEPLRAEVEGRSVPSFAFPESAARALSRAADLADWRRRPRGTVPQLAGVDIDEGRAIARSYLRSAGESPDGVWLPATEAARLCAAFGIPVAPTPAATPADRAVDAADAPGSAGVETIVGVTHDPSFGPLVLFGMGGTMAELLGDRALRILPLTDLDAAELVRSLGGSPLLFGYRGRPAVDVAALEDVLLRVGRLAEDVPEVAEMDLNPVIVSEAGAVAVDVKVRVAPASTTLPPDLRRLRR